MENLLRQRDELKEKIRELDELQTTGVKKILRAIEHQRWFFFSNNEKILFDRNTALVWANLNHFPYGKGNSMPYFDTNDYYEVRRLISETNSQKFGGFSDWKVPEPSELWSMIEDKSFPFQRGKNWRICGYFNWCVDWFGLSRKGLDDSGATSDIIPRSAYVIPCSRAFLPPNFSATPEEVLKIFTTHKLNPNFNDSEAAQLYRKIFIEKIAENKPQLVKKLSEIENQIAELENAQKKSANFDYQPLIKKFDAAAIAKSPIKYFDAVLVVTDELFDALQELATGNAQIIAESLPLSRKIAESPVESSQFKPCENDLFTKRQKFLKKRLELSIDEPVRKIQFVRTQAENFFARLDAISGDNNLIGDLAEIQAESRADFEFLVETMARIINKTRRNINFFAEQKKFAATAVNEHFGWRDDYLRFKTDLRNEFQAICEKSGVDDEKFVEWFDDWQSKRFEIEQKLLPLIEFVFNGGSVEIFDRALKILREYRNSVDKFYLYERKNFQNPSEVIFALKNLAEKFQRALQTSKSCENAVERRFLARFAQQLPG